MLRKFGLLPFVALLACGAPTAQADEKAVLQELRELRVIVEQQARQIEVLTAQVARLNQYLGARYGAVPTVETPTEAPAPADPFAGAPKAEPAAEGQRHVVVKGETLTSIAKHYNVPLGELQKANKALNPAKLQIGQSVTIPKTSEPSTEKKETP